MDVQSAANLNIPEGSVRNIHDKDKRLLWSAVGYDVRYDGDTTQQTYSGKNLFNVNATPTTLRYSTATVDGQSITVTTNDSSNTARVDYSLPYEANKTMTLSYDYEVLVNNTTLGSAIVYLRSPTDSASDAILETSFSLTVGNKGHKTVTLQGGTPDTTKRLWLYVKTSSASGVVSVKFSNIQLEYAGSETSYEPYVGGIPAPNPDYPQDVNVVKGEQDILVSAKNLLSVSFAVAGGVPSDIPTNTFVLDRENQRFFRCDFPTLLPPGTYTISFDISNNNTLSGVSFNIFNKSETSISGAYNLSGSHYSGTFTFNESVKIIRWFIASNESNDKHATISNVQIECGSTATAYEMYQGQQTFPVDLIGKNLFSGWIIGKRINSNGVEVNDQNGAASDFMPVVANTNYTFSDIPDGLYTFIAAYNSQKQFLGRTGASGGSSSKGCKTLASYFSYGTPAGTGDVAYLRVAAYQSGQYADPISVVSSLKTQLEVGTSATPYVPYYNYELCKIGNYQDYIFKSSGKNLFDGVLEVGIINGITGLDQANNNYVRAEDYIPVEELTYYRISTDNANISSVFVYEYKADKTYNLAANKSLTLTDVYRTEEGTAFIRFRPNYQTTDTSIKFQVEKGTVATPYEPYGTDWYVHKAIGKVVLDGSESWTAISVSGTLRYFFTNIDNIYKVSSSEVSPTYSNYFSPATLSGIYRASVDYGIAQSNDGLSSATHGLRVRHKDMVDATAFQTWLSTHNTSVYYALETPTYTKITDSTLIGQLNAVHDWLRRYDYYGVVTGNLPIIINRTGLT